MSEEVYHLPTDTVHVNMESRQYKAGIDLGEGIRRMAILLWFTLTVGWTALLLFLGFNIIDTIALYLGPPLILTIVGIQDDAGGRYRYVAWVDRLRYLRRRRRPLIPLPGHGTGTRNQPFVTHPEIHIIDTTTVKGT